MKVFEKIKFENKLTSITLRKTKLNSRVLFDNLANIYRESVGVKYNSTGLEAYLFPVSKKLFWVLWVLNQS